MRLTAMSSSIIHQVISDEINVIYEPDNSLFDHILCTCNQEINYYAFSNDAYAVSENFHSLPASHIDIYDYDIYVSNEIMNLVQSKNSIGHTFHVTDLIFQHRYKPLQMKKEDLSLINHKTKNKSKIFFDQTVLSSWGCENSQLISYGIPLNLFTSHDNDRNSNVLILSHNETVSQKIQNYFSSRNIQCEIINSFNQLSISETVDKFNQYKIVLDLNNTTINQLCALACGCNVVALSHQPSSTPLINTQHSVDGVVAYCDTLLNNTDKIVNNEEIKNYLDTNFNYDKFQTSISEIMEFNKRKAFIL